VIFHGDMDSFPQDCRSQQARLLEKPLGIRHAEAEALMPCRFVAQISFAVYPSYLLPIGHIRLVPLDETPVAERKVSITILVQ
jgi:hypothetical protein